MKLPNSDFAIVPLSKLEDYLLSRTHAIGKMKAKFFRDFGYNEMNMESLMKGLKEIAKECEIVEQISILHGEKYIIDGALQTPSGKTITIRTVWIIEIGDNSPRFVTAYPN